MAQDPTLGLRYAGELIGAFIERAGGRVHGKVSVGTVPEDLKPVYVHRQSRRLSEILAQLLLDSNNFTANQVFLEIGGHSLGGPVSLEKSLKVANETFAAHGLAGAFHLEEGSGISRDDRLTARGLAKVLELFAPHADLLHGHDGGLNKTGTMDGVRTLAGYADTASHGRVRFVISRSGRRRRDALPDPGGDQVGAVELFASGSIRAVSVPAPPCGGGSGWGVASTDRT